MCSPAGSTRPADLPISFPGAGSTQPSTYLAPTLGQRNEVTVVDPTPLFPFGHGLGYATATWAPMSTLSGRRGTSTGPCQVEVELVNDSDRSVAEVVQVYLHDLTASVVRPVQQLVGAVRVDLPAASGRAFGSRSTPT